MPLTGPVPEGGTFFCPHCGAMYSATLPRLPKTDRNIAKCVVCGQTMDTPSIRNDVMARLKTPGGSVNLTRTF